MSYDNRYKYFDFFGPLQEPIKNFIDEKRAVGRLFNKQSQMLAKIDKLSTDFDCQENILCRSFVEAWIERTSHETRKNQRYRVNLIKQLAKFMNKHGYEAYLTPLTISLSEDIEFIPYIFNKEQVKKLFRILDNWPESRQYPAAHLVWPELFRILYCCGLRVSEVVNLKLKDIDFDQDVLFIRESKFDKKRIVPFSRELSQRLHSYTTAMHFFPDPNTILFPNARNNAHQTRKVYEIFREVLWQAGISHGGKGKGPRLHDLRHTFSVHCLQKWLEANVDLKVALPYLSAYLGHYDLSGTQKYLRLTVEAFPHLIQQIEHYSLNIIPRLEVEEDE